MVIAQILVLSMCPLDMTLEGEAPYIGLGSHHVQILGEICLIKYEIKVITSTD
jgi:hypothetical protein